MGRTESSIRFETFYPHPVAKVWRALTDSDALAEWLMPNDFTPVLGHRFTFRTHPVPPFFEGVVHSEVVELDPPRSLAFTWDVPGLHTLVRWELTPATRDVPGTLLVGVHSGFDLTDHIHYTAFRGMSGGWGGGMVAKLDRVLAALSD